MDSILERFSDNLTDVKYITNPAIARDEEIKKLLIKTKKMHSKHYQDLLNILQ